MGILKNYRSKRHTNLTLENQKDSLTNKEPFQLSSVCSIGVAQAPLRSRLQVVFYWLVVNSSEVLITSCQERYGSQTRVVSIERAKVVITLVGVVCIRVHCDGASAIAALLDNSASVNIALIHEWAYEINSCGVSASFA